MNIYEFCRDGESGPEQDASLRYALNLVMDGGGNHTDARYLYPRYGNPTTTGSWEGAPATTESYAISDLRDKLKSMGMCTDIANILISSVWRPDDKPPGYGRVRLRLDEVCLYLCDMFLQEGWNKDLEENTRNHLRVLRKIISHIPPPRRVVVHSFEKTGWFVLEGTRCSK